MPRAQRKGLSLIYSPTPNILPAVSVDPTKFKEVLTNLITNAIKYTEHGGIIVSATQKDNNIVFLVKDTGRGIASENIPKLFQKFYREDTSLSASNPETGGTGLGLYITKSIIELMHGEIWVESIQGQGSIFYFSLPATNVVTTTTSISSKAHKGVFIREDYLKMKASQPTDGQADTSSPLLSFVVPEPQTNGQITTSAPSPLFVVPESKPDGQNMPLQSFTVPEPLSTKKKILLVEDEVEMRTFYVEFLSDKYEVDTAIDGIDGIAKLRLKNYDLILLDIMMPKLNGVGFLKEQQKDPEFAKTPVILLTNFGEEETLRQCFELGVKSMIIKSDVLPDEIIPVIEKEFQKLT